MNISSKRVESDIKQIEVINIKNTKEYKVTLSNNKIKYYDYNKHLVTIQL